MSIGYPGTIGIVWQPSDRLAFRPDFTFGYSNTGGGGSSSSNQWKIGTGISTLIYLRTTRPFRVYVSPRYGYRRISLTSKTTSNVISFTGSTFVSTPQTVESMTRNNEHGVAGVAGVEIRVNDGLGFYGEGGVQYRRLERTAQSGTTPTAGTTVGDVGSVGGVGVTVYF
jgi:hypothetical protein